MASTQGVARAKSTGRASISPRTRMFRSATPGAARSCSSASYSWGRSAWTTRGWTRRSITWSSSVTCTCRRCPRIWSSSSRPAARSAAGWPTRSRRPGPRRRARCSTGSAEARAPARRGGTRAWRRTARGTCGSAGWPPSSRRRRTTPSTTTSRTSSATCRWRRSCRSGTGPASARTSGWRSPWGSRTSRPCSPGATAASSASRWTTPSRRTRGAPARRAPA
mmetsp:Transcript_36125/g.109225  ORF Transcript_36125/g.109225 Transcript_36125/m.109225 type:complete len:222 (-) Transcript_36125:211-876(-)